MLERILKLEEVKDDSLFLGVSSHLAEIIEIKTAEIKKL